METNNEILILSHHRNKKRIRDLGEVFTPEKYVQEMLGVLDKKMWSDSNCVFRSSEPPIPTQESHPRPVVDTFSTLRKFKGL